MALRWPRSAEAGAAKVHRVPADHFETLTRVRCEACRAEFLVPFCRGVAQAASRFDPAAAELIDARHQGAQPIATLELPGGPLQAHDLSAVGGDLDQSATPAAEMAGGLHCGLEHAHLRVAGDQRQQLPAAGRADQCDQAAQGMHTARAAALADHVVEPWGTQPRALGELLRDELVVGIEALGSGRLVLDGGVSRSPRTRRTTS